MTYTLAGYALGVALLTAQHWALNLVGVLLTGHTLVYAAYFIHEFAHQTVFRSPEANNRWGTLMSWIAGSCYAPFSALRRKHMRHHTDRADVLTFDYKKFLNESPGWVRRLVVALEWLHIPAVEFVMHGYVMLLPFLKRERRAERPRLIAILLVRVALFALLGWYSLKALLLYAVAYMIMLHALRFTDAFQHTYDAFAVLESGRHSGRQGPRPRLRAGQHLLQPGFGRPSVVEPAAAQLPVSQRASRAAHRALARPAAAARAAVPRRLRAGPAHAQAAAGATTAIACAGCWPTTMAWSEAAPNKADGFIGAVGVSFLTAV